MIRLILVFALLIVPQSCFSQGTFNGQSAGQQLGGRRPPPTGVYAKQKIDATKEGLVVQFGVAYFEVLQVVDKGNARINFNNAERAATGAIFLASIEA